MLCCWYSLSIYNIYFDDDYVNKNNINNDNNNNDNLINNTYNIDIKYIWI
jgi:hypothetical protein